MLISGDGDFRRLVEAVQRRGVRVTVISTIRTQPPMIADELRRQADFFLDLSDLQPYIAREHVQRPEATTRRRPRARAARGRSMTASTMTTASPTRTEPPRPVPQPDCPLCPRLAAFRQAQPGGRAGLVQRARAARSARPTAPLVMVGLAPGLRGANRTGRPFTGDYAGEVLYPALLAHGLARGRSPRIPRTGWSWWTAGSPTRSAACRLPNKPTPAEIATCSRFLVPELTAGAPPRVILALGRMAHAAALRALGMPASRFPFGHGAEHRLPTGQVLVASFTPRATT